MGVTHGMEENAGIGGRRSRKVFDPLSIDRNPRFVAIISARRADITARMSLHTGLGNVASGPAEVLAFLNGAQISDGGYTIFGLPSRSRQGAANITTSIECYINQRR